MLLVTKHLRKIPVLLKSPGAVQVVTIFGILLFLISVIPCLAAEDYLPFKGIIHIHSNISGGAHSSFEILNLSREKGIKIVIFTDSLLRRWEYGIWPLENLVKRKYEEPSIVTYGIKRYLKKIDNLNGQFSDMVVLAGIEVAPFYWWEGSPFERKLYNFNWGKHLLVVGLDYRDYEYLPVVSKRHIFPQDSKDFISLVIPIFLILLGGILLFHYRLLGYITLFSGTLLLWGNYPFLSKYDAYHGSRGYKPYQEFIDYVRKKGGFVSWAHPGGEYSRSLGRKVDIFTLKYYDVLTNTFDYNAFGGLDISTCSAGKEWDTVLKEFCLNKRKNPAWAIGEIDYHGLSPREKIDEIQTVFFLRQLNKGSVFEALKKGRFYCARYTDDFYIDLEDFSLEGRIAGETAKVKAQPKLIIKGNAHIQPEEEIKLEIIRTGEVAKVYEIKQGRFALEFIDDTFQDAAKKIYYRLNFFSQDKLILVSNPIFCEAR